MKLKLKNINKDLKIAAKACPLFVPMIEEGLTDHTITHNICKLYLDIKEFKTIDVLILGCTHYPLLMDIIKKHISNNITIINSANIVAIFVEKFLHE